MLPLWTRGCPGVREAGDAFFGSKYKEGRESPQVLSDNTPPGVVRELFVSSVVGEKLSCPRRYHLGRVSA